jgi:hypothetical protein
MAQDNKPAATKESLLKELAEAKAALDVALENEHQEMVVSKEPYASQRDPSGWLGSSQEVYDKFFKGYPGVAARIETYKEQIRERLWVISPIGQRRTMYRILTGDPSFIAGAERRAVNSPIQGISSQVGITAAYLIQCEVYEYCLARKIPVEYTTMFVRAVHDASYFEESYRLIIPAIHINQHMATVGVHEYYKREFNYEFLLDPEIEMEVGASDARAESWNWVLDDLPPLLIKALDDRIKDGYVKAEHRAKALEVIFRPWVNKAERQYLQRKYPLLQVSDLEEEICLALERNNITPER